MMVILSTLVLLVVIGEVGFRIHGAFYSIGGAEDPDAFHLYVIGGSSAAGVPYRPLSFGVLVSAMFGDELVGRPVVLHNLAACGDTTYTQWIRFVRAVRGRDPAVPGAALIYAGHNDSGGDILPEGAPLLTRLERGISRRSVLGRETLFGVRRLLRRSAAIGGQSYGYYLRELVDTAHAAGLTPVLSTVVGNICDVEPSYETDDRAGVARALAAVAPAVEEGRCEAAREALSGALPDGRGREAFATYRFAHCLRHHGQWDQAWEAYLRALELDPQLTFGRAKRRHNEVVRRVGEEHGAVVVDAVARFSGASRHGLIGESLFSDGHHPNLRGHLLLAEGFAEALAARFDAPVVRRFDGEEALRAAFPRDDPALPFLHSGLWLLGVSLRHPWAEDRLRVAAARFRRALVEDPQSFTAWMGLGLAQAAATSDVLHGPDAEALIEGWGGFTYGGFNVPARDLDVLLDLLRRAGVDEEIIAGVAANHPERPETAP
jgi:tetratricopeptide (TPR) repeat protein